jgi:SNF2 family DNA or RNA helicase
VTLLQPNQLHDYQRGATTHQLIHDDTMLWMTMGTGKTICTLTTIVDRMRAGLVQKTLIVGPLRVIQSVWATEARKWEHTKHLTFSVIHGTKQKRLRQLFTEADVYLINYENLAWFAGELTHYYLNQDRPIPFQMVVYDEVSKLKSSTAQRMAGGIRDVKDKQGVVHKIKITGWRTMINLFKYRTGLTGTPASNGYMDLHGQFLAVDGGQRLGEYVTHYKKSYFSSDYNGWNYVPTDLGMTAIENNISDIVFEVGKEYLDMPDVNLVNMMVDLPPGARKHYAEMEKEMFTKLDNETELEVFSRSSVSNKCLQICNGGAYIEAGMLDFEVLHDAKLDALEEVLEEAAGQPVLCSYSFVADAERIMKRFKKYKPVNLTKTKSSLTGDVIEKWNSGGIKLLIGHPASMGHGIDGLQHSGNIIVWFGVNWSLELYDQMNARIDRQGQEKPVSVIRILCNDTIDLAVADAIERKADTQEGLKSAIQRYRTGVTTNELAVTFF